MKVDFWMPEGGKHYDISGIARLEMTAESEKERFILLTLVEFYESLRDGEAGFASRPLSIYNAEIGS